MDSALMDVFVYGTLQSPALCKAVAGGAPIVQTPAHLVDYEICSVAQKVVPLIRATPGAVAQGMVLRAVTPDQLRRLDTYEGAFGYALIDVTVQTSSGAVCAKMYLPPDGSCGGKDPWSFDHWVAHYAQMAVFAATEIFAHDPALTPAQVARNWGMIEKRGWAKQVAQAQTSPATVRHSAQPTDVDMRNQAPPQGGFYRLQKFQFQHRKFDDTQSALLHREVLVGVDAVLVLPYDPVRDCVLLVEQVRMGPVVRRDPNPWILEPVAGMIDATETPLQSARRETIEEAGLTDIDLQHLSSFYPSPGSSTDYFHAYLGLCDLPDNHQKFGGLITESEDLRLHIIPFDQAMTLVTTGEINAGPLVMMLCMLGIRRDALRHSG